jgi:hypothetical protein
MDHGQEERDDPLENACAVQPVTITKNLQYDYVGKVQSSEK